MDETIEEHFKKYNSHQCTNPDCKAEHHGEPRNWLFFRAELGNTGQWFQINFCEKCFKKMRKYE